MLRRIFSMLPKHPSFRNAEVEGSIPFRSNPARPLRQERATVGDLGELTSFQTRVQSDRSSRLLAALREVFEAWLWGPFSCAEAGGRKRDMGAPGNTRNTGNGGVVQLLDPITGIFGISRRPLRSFLQVRVNVISWGRFSASPGAVWRLAARPDYVRVHECTQCRQD
jgi:hypothetical protein